MTLPSELEKAIQAGAEEYDFDAPEAVRAIKALFADDAYIDYLIWFGPGFGQEGVKVDVYLLGERCLYNYCVMQDVTTSALQYLDTVDTIAIATVAHPRSRFMMLIGIEPEKSRIFGDDLSRLESFRMKLTTSIHKAKRG